MLSLELDLDLDDNGGFPPLSVVLLSSSSVEETSAEGTTVGFLSVVGGAPSVAFSLTDSAGGRFEVLGSSLLAGPTATDYETGESHSIAVRASSAGQTLDQTFTIEVVDIIDDDEYAQWMAAA